MNLICTCSTSGVQGITMDGRTDGQAQIDSENESESISTIISHPRSSMHPHKLNIASTTNGVRHNKTVLNDCHVFIKEGLTPCTYNAKYKNTP